MTANTLPVVRADKLEVEREEQRWLIEGLWARSAIGLIGGAPKCCKTWLGLDMAVSVATGTKALEHFPTVASGPALIYLAEDALPQVRCRIEALCNRRHVDIRSLDLFVITSPVLRLDLQHDQQRLAETIAAFRPRLVLLDPLVRMHRLDENSAAEISGLLGYIRDLQRRFDVAIVLVHHASKKHRSQPGQALRGSSDLHAIGDCNAYLARNGQHLVLTIEHRAAKSPEPLLLELDVRGGDSALCVVADAPPGDDTATLDDRILDLIRCASEPMTRGVLRSRLHVNNQRLGDALRHLDDDHKIHRTDRGWTSELTSPQSLPGEAEAGSAEAQLAEE